MTVDSPWFKIGVSLFTDEDFQQLDLAGQWGYLTLHGLARLGDGDFGRVAATNWLAQFRHPGVDPEAVFEALEKAGMVRLRQNGRWEVAGWSKHQRLYRTEDPEKKRERNARRPTTRAGRRGELPSPEPVPSSSAPLSFEERSVARRGALAGADTGADAGARGSALLFSSPPEKNGHQEKREGGPGGNQRQDRDIRDLLYELTGAKPWGTEWGDKALDLAANYGRAEAEEAIQAFRREGPARRPSPWELLRGTEARLSRDQAKRKEQERVQARRDRAKPKERETISEEEYARIEREANYREPGDE
jgi:hypothetical protein